MLFLLVLDMTFLYLAAALVSEASRFTTILGAVDLCCNIFGASAENALQMAAKMAATKMLSVTVVFIVGFCVGGGCVYDGVLREGWT